MENARPLAHTIIPRRAILGPKPHRIPHAVEPILELPKVLVDPVRGADERSPVPSVFPGRYVCDVTEAEPGEAVLAGSVRDLRFAAGAFDGFGVVG